eukprot:2674187-Pyramimonas_sp.AAC.1
MAAEPRARAASSGGNSSQPTRPLQGLVNLFWSGCCSASFSQRSSLEYQSIWPCSLAMCCNATGVKESPMESPMESTVRLTRSELA